MNNASLPSPCFIADIAALRQNLSKAAWLKQQTGCKILLATKAFSMFSLFPLFAEMLDGTTASGLYEARLGAEEFGGEVHAYSPAYSAGEVEALLPLVSHLYFNSVLQLQDYLSQWDKSKDAKQPKLGLRLNPQFSQVTNSSLYDPSAPHSRFGVKAESLTAEVLAKIHTLHVHNLCENLAEDSAALIHHLIQTVPHALEAVSEVNLGGGHYITHPDYDLPKLAEAINYLQQRFKVTVTLEPGGALAYNAGVLSATVLDIITPHPKSEISASPTERGVIAILDTSATCHMPDVLEMPYTPRVSGTDASKPANTQLTGKTCLTGDVIGDYHFPVPLQKGDRVIFEDMMQYTMVKTTTFNGLPLPAIAIQHEDGRLEVVKEFSYEDFKGRLS